MRCNWGCASGGGVRRKIPEAPPTSSAATTAAAGSSQRLRDADADAAEADVLEMLETDSRSKAMSCADWKRWAGCFSRQWRTIRSSAGEILLAAIPEREGKSGGSSFRIAVIVSALVLRLNARWPHSISYRMPPK